MRAPYLTSFKPEIAVMVSRARLLVSMTPKKILRRSLMVIYRVRMAQRKPGKRDFLEKNQGKPGKLREFSDHFYNLRENLGNFILPNISDQIDCALRINE